MKKTLTEVVMVSKSQFETLQKLYENHLHTSKNRYVIFFAKDQDLSVTVYKHDEQFKVVFQGRRASEESLLFKSKQKSFQPHMGSDEVGTGDFFGPIVVAAAYVDESQAETLRGWGVKDSKMLDDSLIKSIAKKLIKAIPYSINILDNQIFNTWTAKKMNMNEVKAVLHHQVLSLLSAKIKKIVPLIIDQFCDEKHFHTYLKKQALTPLPRMQFFEKAENQYLAVAAASIIARYRFLLAMEHLDKTHLIHFPFGASPAVETFGLTFAKQHGLNALAKLVKTNFSTFQRIKKSLS